MLDYEKLDVYRIALKFVVTTVEIRDRLPRGNGELQDQFKRASFSIALNIAEGAGKLKQADKRRYFSIVRGSVIECGALFDLFNALGTSPRTNIAPESFCLRGLVPCFLNFTFRACDHSFSGTFTFTCSRPEIPILPTRFHEEP
jgi:four helix bundle protein